MRHLTVTLMALLLQLPLIGQPRYTNPVLHQDFSDPDVCRAGEDYYLTASSFNCFPGLPVLHSRDLVHWNQCGAALLSYEGFGPADGVRPGCGVWAPAIRHHDGWFYIFAGDPDRGIFMVRTKDPAGRWEAPVWLVEGKGFIDPCPIWDEDGKAYLSHALAGSRAGLKSVVLVAEMSPDGTSLLGPSRIVFDGHLTQPTIEGTKFYKRDGYYYIFAPAGGVKGGWQTVLRSRSPFGPFEEKIVLASAEGTINGPHQGAWVQTPSGEDWFLHFQDKGAYGRILHLEPMVWNADGWPVIGTDPDGDGVGQPVSEWTAPEGFAYEAAEDATGPYGIPFSWQFPCVPSPFWYSALPGGGFRLYSVTQEGKTSLSEVPNRIESKFIGEKSYLQARLSFRPDPSLDGEECGIAVTGSGFAGLRLTDTPSGVTLDYFRSGSGAENPSAEDVTRLRTLPLSDVSVIWVRVDVYPRGVEGSVVPKAVCTFSYSLDGKEFTAVPGSFTASAGAWTGAKAGFFCNRYSDNNDSGWVDVTDIRAERDYVPPGGFLNKESGVPAYTLPDVLTTYAGKKVKSAGQWEKVRRKELMKAFTDEMFGALPEGLPRPAAEVRSVDTEALGGIATRKQVRLNLSGDEAIDLLLYVPNKRQGKVPAFVGVNFAGNHTVSDDPGIFLPDTARYRSDFAVLPRGENSRRWPLELILSRGYAVATFCCEDIYPDSRWYPEVGVKAEYPEASWDAIAAWGWGLSCALDYLIEDEDVDGEKVAVFGHSRLGKTALWAGARDTRFALVVSNDSGCAGAAISRRRFGETVRKINDHFPHWFADRFRNYDDNEDALPFDQHCFLALIAPRPLYVASASEDLWADPVGEFLSLSEASKVYALYGNPVITPGERPSTGGSVVKGLLGAHLREGRHEILAFDWERYLDFADIHLK